MKGLTEKQLKITQFIKEYIRSRGYSPSYREIQHHFGYSSLSSVFDHLHALKNKNVITFEKGRVRSLQLTESTSEIEIPLIGLLKEASGLHLFQNSQSVVIPQAMIPSPETSFALKVVGTFLQEEMIDDGDLLVVETRDEAEDGETVLISVEHATLIKRIFYEDEHLLLASRLAGIDPIVMKQAHVNIRGVIVALFRSY